MDRIVAKLGKSGAKSNLARAWQMHAQMRQRQAGASCGTRAQPSPM
jgi:hypothetical protein